MSSPFCTLLRVRYGECDAQQVVFNARYGDYVDVALTEFFRALFGSYQALLAQGLDGQVVRMATDWKSSARFDEVLAMEVSTSRVGTTSYTLLVRISEYFSGRHVADVEIVYVMVDAERKEKVTVPDDVRHRLLAGAPGERVDMAGLGEMK
ncbi:MAG TPA: thioesterase family protein [Moraxellaceae bacterium]|nr:thioesterase family protein [Moraxellaceae bacterium]